MRCGGTIVTAGKSTAADIDMICVRENSEGEYAGVGGRIHRGTPHEVANQTGVFTRHGIERILRYGFELARTRPRRLLASATKSNALTHSMVLWDEVAEVVRKDYPDVQYAKYHVDALAARMITHPQTLDVLVTSNLFSDILTDIGSAISGSLGIAPGREYQPGAYLPVDVRADSRLGAGHRWQRHRQSDRRSVGSGAFGRPSRAIASSTIASSMRWNGSSPPERPSHA